MESYSAFEVSYAYLRQQIIEGVRKQAPENNSGAIRIVADPLTRLADMWINGEISDFDEKISPETYRNDFVRKLNPEGSFIMQYRLNDGRIEPLDCYAYTAMRVAYASWEHKYYRGVSKKDLPENFESHLYHSKRQALLLENGYAVDDGSASIIVKQSGEPFLWLCVSVCGTRSSQLDGEYAKRGLNRGCNYLKCLNGNVEFCLNQLSNFDFVSIYDAYK